MKEMSFKEAAIHLDTAESTLRRWCMLLEQAGYVFTRKGNNRRVLSERELKDFQMLKSLSTSMTLDDACLQLVRMTRPSAGDYQAVLAQFEQHLKTFKDRCYWAGIESAYGQLIQEWDEVKTKLTS